MGTFVVRNEMRMSLGDRCWENFSLNQGGVFINLLFSDLKFSLNQGGFLLNRGFLLNDPVYGISQ